MWACCCLSETEGVFAACVFLFVYAIYQRIHSCFFFAWISWVGEGDRITVRQLKTDYICFKFKSFFIKIVNKYNTLQNWFQSLCCVTLLLIQKNVLIESKTIWSSRVPTFKNCWQACCVCLRRHCSLLVWRPGQSVWEPGSKEKRSVPLTWPWIFPNVPLYQRFPFPPEWLWQAASVVMVLNFWVIAISKVMRDDPSTKPNKLLTWRRLQVTGVFLSSFPERLRPLLFLWPGTDLRRVWGPNPRRQSATSHVLVSGWVFVPGERAWGK